MYCRNIWFQLTLDYRRRQKCVTFVQRSTKARALCDGTWWRIIPIQNVQKSNVTFVGLGKICKDFSYPISSSYFNFFSFSNELYLKRHIQRHNNRTEMLCPLCSKVSFSKAALGAHIRNTHSERSHKCTFCEKAFRNKKVLTVRSPLFVTFNMHNNNVSCIFILLHRNTLLCILVKICIVARIVRWHLNRTQICHLIAKKHIRMNGKQIV